MPHTRSQGQAKIDFPARKSVRVCTSKTAVVSAKAKESILQSPRKRTTKGDVAFFEEASPSKRKKDKTTENSVGSVSSLTPIKMLTPKREPLTPRKENIMSPPSLRQNSTVSRTPGKENALCSNVNVLSSPQRSQWLSPRSSNLPSTPTVKPITKGRFLSFDSPVKSDNASRHVSTPRPKVPVMSPLRLARQDGVCYQKAKQALNTAIPDRLLCREKEFAEVNTFLQNHLYKGVPGSLYISGAPGTGKTAVLTQVMDKLKAEKQQLVYINCMSLRSSHAIYNTILDQLSLQKNSLSSKQALNELEKKLTSKGSIIMLILDEMDQLDSKNQEILYTMFEWPSLKGSRLVLIGIANALDLTDRILPRLLARPKCRPELLHFPPYSREQIIRILQERLNKAEVDGENVLEMSALRFCASKVAAITGDMRKALDICRRAVELVQSDVRRQQILNLNLSRSPSKQTSSIKKIGVPHIMKIVNEVYGSSSACQRGKVQNIPLQQKLATCTLLLLVKNGKSKEVTAGKLHETYTKVSKKQNVPCIDQSEFLSVCSLLEARGIIRIKKTKDARSAKISLKLDESELESTLQDKPLISSVLQTGLLN